MSKGTPLDETESPGPARGQAPAWGAGSRSIIYSNGEAGTNQSLWSIAFDLDTGARSGTARPLTVGRGADLQAVSSRDGKAYRLCRNRDLNPDRNAGPAQGWRSAPPEKITDFDLTFISFIENPQISRDGKRFAYSRSRISSDIWLMTLQNKVATSGLDVR